MKRLPEFLKEYFWDVEFEKVNLAKSRSFVLGRILEYGNDRAAEWMLNVFDRNEVEKLLSFARIDPRSANFWAIVYNIDRKHILCLQKHYLEIRRKHWPY